MFEKQYRVQYLATLIADLGLFLFGIVIGWVSPNLILLSSESTPLKSGPLNELEKQWIPSIGMIGSCIAVPIFGFCVDRLGRKQSIILIGLFQIISWTLLFIADNANYIMSSRFLSGMSGTGIFIVIPSFVSEISDSKIRGRLGSAFSVICNIGIVMEFVMAKYLNFYTIPLIALVVAVIFVLGISMMPETPQFLISKNKFSDAEKSFKFYRGYQPNELMSAEHTLDFDNLKMINPSDKDNDEEDILELFKRPGALKRTFLAFAVSNFPILSGCSVLITFTHEIFQDAGSSLDVDASSILFALIQLLGSAITVPLIDRVGRRMILAATALGSAICFCVFGTFLSMKTNHVDVSSFSFIPLYSLCLCILISSIGIIPVPNIVVPEILDQKIRGIVMSICNLEAWTLGFLMIHFYLPLTHLIGVHGVMFIFTATCLSCSFFSFLILPETKGRDIEEIADSIGKK